MAAHNLTAQALPAVENFLTRAVARLPWDNVQPFVREVAQEGNKDAATAAATAEIFYHVLRDNPSDLKLGSMLLKEDLVQPIDGRKLLYQAMLDRYNDALLATAQGGVYQDESSEGPITTRLDNHE